MPVQKLPLNRVSELRGCSGVPRWMMQVELTELGGAPVTLRSQPQLITNTTLHINNTHCYMGEDNDITQAAAVAVAILVGL